jgi:hypothetical protein
MLVSKVSGELASEPDAASLVQIPNALCIDGLSRSALIVGSKACLAIWRMHLKNTVTTSLRTALIRNCYYFSTTASTCVAAHTQLLPLLLLLQAHVLHMADDAHSSNKQYH